MLIKDNNVVGRSVSSPSHIADVFHAILAVEDPIDQEKEHFWVMFLNGARRVKSVDLITLGIMNMSPIHPREVFRRAIIECAYEIIICHNHPSGNCSPSAEDTAITTKLVDAGNLLSIKVLDHIIIGNNGGYNSLLEMGLIC